MHIDMHEGMRITHKIVIIFYGGYDAHNNAAQCWREGETHRKLKNQKLEFHKVLTIYREVNFLTLTLSRQGISFSLQHPGHFGLSCNKRDLSTIHSAQIS